MDRFKDIDTEDRVRLAAVRFWQRCDSLMPGSLIIKRAQALILRSVAARTTQDIDVQYNKPEDDDEVETPRGLIYAAADLPVDDRVPSELVEYRLIVRRSSRQSVGVRPKLGSILR